MTNLQRLCDAIILFFLLLVAGTALSQDVLVMKNGDRITGEITRIWDAEITIEPEYSDEFHVDVPAVDHIISDREFEIDFEDGRKVVAKLPGADSDGNQLLNIDGDSMAVLLAMLFELNEPEEHFDWAVNADISADVKKGNTDTTNSKVRADGMVKFGDHRHKGEITFFREELAGVRTKEQDLYLYNYNYLFNDPWFFSGIVSFEHDPIIGLNSRVIGSAGLGRDIWNTPRRTLNFQLGAGYQNEERTVIVLGVPVKESEDSSVATWALRFRHDFFGDDFGVFHNQNITWNISGRNNTSYKTSTGLQYEISDLFYATFSVDYNYETDPVPGAKSEDLTMLFGFGAEFD